MSDAEGCGQRPYLNAQILLMIGNEKSTWRLLARRSKHL